MADKSQNIFINYKFPMTEAEKASALLTKINQQNNKLQTDATKTGQVVADSYKKAGSSIENAAQQFGDLYSAAKAFVTAGILKEVVDITLAMAELSGKAEGVERAFQRAFPNATALLQDMRAATHDTVTDIELMQQTLQAVNLGIAAKDLPKLFEFAAVRAQQTGVAVDYLVQSIVTGIGRKSLLILDNLGLSASRLKEELGGVALESVSVARATEVVSKIAGEELEKMGGFVKTSETSVKQLTAAWAELRLELAKKVEAGGVIDFVTDILNRMRDQIKGNSQFVIDEAKKLGAEDAKRLLDGLKNFKGTEQEKSDLLQQEINSRVQIEGRYNDKVSKLSAELIKIKANEKREFDDLGQEITIGNPRIAQLEKEIEDTKSAVILIRESRKTLIAEMNQLVAAGVTELSSIISRKEAQIKQLQDAIKATNDIGDLAAGGRLTTALEVAEAELGDLQRAFHEFHIKDFKIKIEDATDGLNKFIKAGEKLNNANLKQRFEIALEKAAAAIPEKLPELGTPSKLDEFFADMGNAWDEFRTEVAVTGVDILRDQLIAAEQAELDSMKNRLRSLKAFYDEQEVLAGDNQKAREILRLREIRETTKLQREIFQKEKETRRSQALIDGAAGVVKAFATYPYPAALIISGLIAAQTISQIRIINKQRPGFKEGVFNIQGPGTGTSDSIPVNVSRGESILTARETFTASDVIKEIRAKRLDNKVLRDLKQGRAPVQRDFNDERIIKAIEKNRPPDVIEQSGIVYKATKKSDTYLQKIRAKSVRL